MTNILTALNITPQIPSGKTITLSVQRPPQQLQIAIQQLPAYQTAEVAGVVTTVNFPQRRNDPTTFRIHCPNSGRTYDAVCDLFCPIRQGDTIYALCMIGPDGKLYVSKPPFVQPAIDRDSMIQCFMRSLRQGYGPAVKLYSMVSKIAGGDEAVIPFLTGIAQSWNDTHNADILFMFNGVEPDDVKKLLSWWHKERNLRRLYLFGLTKKEINACRMTCDDIYQRCMTNPYTVPAIPIEKCDGILDRLNKRPVNEDKIRGAIIRVIWKNLHESGWTGTPTRFLSRQFPGIKDHVEALKHDYDMVAEMETAYLRFPHRVETTIADYIVNKRLTDLIQYDTPIDERIVRDDGKIVHRSGAHFTLEVSEDQKQAIQGALDHSLCIITGAAGTGKTRCVGQIIHNLELRGVTYAVCSFTGKAVARIREVTNKRNPATMHRLISNTRKNQLDKKSNQFEKDIPLMEYEHVIIDEVSMVTTELLYDFIQAYPNIQRLTLVGDVNQLPPIGWGSLFQQILKSETIPVYKLTTNYRVYTADGERDGVILNANAIVSHDPLYPFEFVQTNNLSIIEGPIERVYDIIRGCFGAGIKADQLVIITPYNRSLDILNRTFQDIYNVGARSITDSRGIKWMIGDRVMLTENDQEIGVFNGENGTIRDITDKAVLVDFRQSGCHEFLLEPTHEGRANYEQGTATPYYRRGKIAEAALDGDEGDIDDERTVKRLKHSYALTVDKSQGSEWDFVIVYIDEFNTGSFLNKNRIYTGLTRTKRCCWCVVSDTDAFAATAVKLPPYRCENLGRRIAERLPNLKPFTIVRPATNLDMLNNLPIMPEDQIPQDAMDNGFDCDDFD
ncbi:RecD helicase /ATP-dependent exoDNAse [uncultured virus]|nr:RecD helicase /ATP-dependent exoDNAse [uncultured virus]